MKKIILLIVVLYFVSSNAQKHSVYKFGSISPHEYEITTYDRDTTANALFLYENGETVFAIKNRSIIIKTTYYAKVKIFNKQGFENANIEIPVYNNKNAEETVRNIKATTHNGKQVTRLNKKNVFKDRINENWSVTKFTLPNLKENSIIEYEYTLESPFLFNFTGWEFQSDIPKLFSRFHALIPGNYVYNRRLAGFLKLDVNDVNLKKNCFSIPGYLQAADCEEVTYAMHNIPSYIEEDYTTSKHNYLSAIKFELTEFHHFEGGIEKYTKNWKNVDREFKTERDIGKQLKKIDFIKKQLPVSLFTIQNDYDKAKEVYRYIKDHFTFNNKIRLFREVNVRDAFENSVGNSSEINIALVNALQAVGINADLLIVSTRENGLPTKLYPVITDFNYALAHVRINRRTYVLDATDKLQPFGVIPYNVLNGYGRVMDFDNGSYWLDIEPSKNNSTSVSLDLTLKENGDLAGQMQKSYFGYNALNARKKYLSLQKVNYLEGIENDNENLFIDAYEHVNLDELEEPFKEIYEITYESKLDGKIIFFNPFIIEKISKNPFRLKERTYPVDFGYPRTMQYMLTLTIPDTYKVKSLPENKIIALPQNGGRFNFKVNQTDNNLNILLRFSLLKSYFTPDEYLALKEFFNQYIKTQNSLITLEKI